MIVKIPEILAPAGDIDSLKAAFAAGAGAVYFGLPGFNARQRAENIKPELLPVIVAEAYLRGIKLYLTINTLITEEEIPSVLELIDRAMLAGIRAFIVQDPAVIYMLKKTWPEAEIHISTQATTHTRGQIRFLADCGVVRINLARELTVNEVRELTLEAHSLGIETEVFVHGSYCISYSGQCYLCSFLEGCSGNRGLCQQNCRRVYKKQGKSGYFLNLKDNSAADFSSELIDAGVDSLKIEGRIKSPAYVYSTVKGWRGLIENAASFVPDSDGSGRDKARALFEGVFNRGFSDSYLSGSVSSGMFSSSPLDQSLKQCAAVLSYTADTFTLYTDAQLPGGSSSEIIIKDSAGSFVCAADAEEIEYSSGIAACEYRIKIKGRLDGKITRGCYVYSSRPALSPGEVQNSIDSVVFRKIPVTALVRAEAGLPFELELKLTVNAKPEAAPGLAPAGITLEGLYPGGITLYKSDNLLEKSLKNTGSGKDDFIKQLSRFGNTPFELADTVFEKWEEGLFIPAGEVNKARRKCASLLLGTIDAPRKDKFMAEHYSFNRNIGGSSPGNLSRLAVFLDNAAAADKLLTLYGSDIDIMFEAAGPAAVIPEGCIPVFPSVMDASAGAEAEKAYSEYIKSSTHKTVVLNNTALAAAALDSGKNWIAGNFLNITNSLALQQLCEVGGCRGAIASLELSSAQIMALIEKSQYPVSMFIYSAVRLMTTRQCLLGQACGKKTADKSCYYASCGEDNLDETKGRRLKIVKRAWNYTELYASGFISIPEAVPVFNGKVSGFIIDLRNFSFAPHNAANINEIIEITEIFNNYIKTPDQEGKNRINSLSANTSKGNTRKGLA